MGEGRWNGAVSAWFLRRLIWAAPLLGGLLMVSLFSRAVYEVGPLQVELAVEIFDGGRTTLSIPPVGDIFAATHRTPLHLTVRLDKIDPAGIEALLTAADTEELLADWRAAALQTVRRYVAWLLLLGLAGGMLSAALLPPLRSRPRLPAAAVLGAGAIFGALGLTYATYDAAAFEEPGYDGIVAAAPWAVGLVDQTLLQARELSDQMKLLAENLSRLVDRAGELEPLGELEAPLRVLLIGDIHDNPLGFDLVERVLALFHADLILDVGDLTDYGTDVESAQAAERIQRLGLPYLFVPGNHDSKAVADALAAAGARVLADGGVVEVKGLRFLGIADPSAVSLSPGLPGPDDVLEAAALLERKITEAYGAGRGPHIVAVHNGAILSAAAGRGPILAEGHTHRARVERIHGSIWINPGSTGAAGIRGLQAQREVPYALAVLYLDEGPDGWYLRALDQIEVRQRETGFTVHRRLFPPPPPED